MTVSSSTSSVSYSGNGSTTVFAYTFKIFENSDLVVSLKNNTTGVSTTQTLTTDYTVSGAGSDSGGNVTFVTAPPSGNTVIIRRVLPYTQETDYTENDPFPAASHEDALDKLTMLTQQNRDEDAIKLPVGDVTSGINNVVPNTADRADTVLAFDSTGNVTVQPLSTTTLNTSSTQQGFTGDGSTTAFTLASNPGAAGAGVSIYIDGVYQERDTYSISDTTLTFTEAPPNNASIEVLNYRVTDIGTADANNVTYSPNGSGAVQTTVQTKLRESVSVKDFGAVGDGVTDDTAAIQAAIDSSSTARVKFDGSKTYIISSSIVVPQGVLVDCDWTTIIPSSSINCFTIRQGAQLKNLRIDVTGLTYTKAAVLLSPTANVRGGEWPQPVIDGLNVVFSGPSPTDGTALKFDASSYYIQECIVDNLAVYFGNQAISLTAGSGKYCNGNHIKLIAHDSVYAIYEDAVGGGPVAGNVYELIAENNANNCEVQLNEAATVNGALWDRAVLTFKGNYNRVFSGTALVNDNLTDEGKFNSIQGKDVEYYYNKRSRQEYSDKRNNLTALRGEGSYYDNFMTGVLANESTVVDSSGGSGSTSFQAKTYGGANKKWAGVRCILTTHSVTSESMDLRWNDTGLYTGHNPVYMATALLSETADTKYQFGFYKDSNNYIIYDTDLAAGTITPKVKSGGTETAGTPVSVTFGRIFFFRIAVSNDECIFSVGSYSTSSNNVGDGIYNLANEEIISTNIPTSSVLQPRNYVETETSAAKQLSLLSVQVNWSYGYLVP